MSEIVVQAARFVAAILQLAGVLVLLLSNTLFCLRYRKHGSMKKGFVGLAFMRFAMTDEELEKTDAAKALDMYPLAKLLYENWRDSMIGVFITLAGVVISLSLMWM